MKTKEFIKRVEELGFEAEEYESGIYIKDRDGDCVTSVGSKCEYMVDCSWTGFMFLGETKRKSLFELAFEYASTPINKRKEEKKFYLRHECLNRKNGLGYLNLLRDYYPLDFRLMDKRDKANWVTKFTDKDIEQIRDVYEFNLDDFEMIEVE